MIRSKTYGVYSTLADQDRFIRVLEKLACRQGSFVGGVQGDDMGDLIGHFLDHRGDDVDHQHVVTILFQPPGKATSKAAEADDGEFPILFLWP